jgi:hypothetical protein
MNNKRWNDKSSKNYALLLLVVLLKNKPKALLPLMRYRSIGTLFW